jgi:predicted lipoprotein with Yx(FWY)xxD motif
MRPALKILLPTLAVSLTLAACGSSSNGSSSSSQASTASSASATTAAVVKTASNATLGSTVLVNAQGMTLYHLSGESSDRFLCTSAACVASWPPVSASAISTSIGGLAAVKRPDGSQQLAYKGEPLYTFVGDKAPGEANGQGVKADGGTWSAVVASASSTSAAQTDSTPEPTKSYRGS